MDELDTSFLAVRVWSPSNTVVVSFCSHMLRQGYRLLLLPKVETRKSLPSFPALGVEMLKRIFLATIASALTSTAVFSADLPVKAPLASMTPPSWTGFYIGGELGYAWSNRPDNWMPNDPVSSFFSAAASPLLVPFAGQQPLASPYNVKRSGLVGGLEAGYNWQVDPRWVAGIEADFNGANFRGWGSSSSVLSSTTNINLNTSETTDWYDTIRGRIGWLATPNLMIFGTGGWAYGQTRQSATFTFASPLVGTTGAGAGGFVVTCTNNASCYSGSSTANNSGWTAGGGVEWMFDRHWSAKIEYQFVDLGSTTVFTPAPKALIGAVSSYNVIFKDQLNVIRVGVNYRF
jgi:outer membrane immunogenic protein